jgi:hypothetical protein
MVCWMALALSFGDSAAAETVTVPFHSEGSLLIVQVFVEGRPATMILDTGAESTFLTPEAVGISNTVQVGRLRSNSQLAKTVSRNAVISLTEKGRAFSQTVVVISLAELNKQLGSKCAGILGQDFLRNFRAFTIDFQSHTIAFMR